MRNATCHFVSKTPNTPTGTVGSHWMMSIGFMPVDQCKILTQQQ
jgi:hypothetical protein